MDVTAIIVAIITGMFGLISSILIKIKTPTWSDMKKLGVILVVVITCIVVIFGIFWITMTDVTITYPEEGDEVGHELLVRGTSNNIPKDHVIWIIVYEPFMPLGAQYYPMQSPVTIDKGGDWSAITTLGGDLDIGKNFTIIAILANEKAQEIIENYNEGGEPEAVYPAEGSTPVGAVEYDRVIVKRVLDHPPVEDFSISVSPMDGIIEATPAEINTTITVEAKEIYEHTVRLSATGEPSGMILTFNPKDGYPTPSYNSTLLIDVGPDVLEKEYRITIGGEGDDGKNYNCTYILTVEKPDFNISASAGPGGTIEPSGTIQVNQSESRTFTITPESGYQILDLKVDGVSKGNVSTYPLENIQKDYELLATFSQIPEFDIFASAEHGGTIIPSGTRKVVQGKSINYTITPESGYQILDVKVDGVSQGNISTYPLLDIQDDHEILATFSQISPTVTISFPSVDDEVGHEVLVQGTSQNIPSDLKIWVIVDEPFADPPYRYYIQTRGVTKHQNGDWTAVITIGGQEDDGENFYIIAVLANEDAQKEIDEYVEGGEPYEGRASIPDGTIEYDRVLVTLNWDLNS